MGEGRGDEKGSGGARRNGRSATDGRGHLARGGEGGGRDVNGSAIRRAGELSNRRRVIDALRGNEHNNPLYGVRG